MDPALLTNAEFWQTSVPLFAAAPGAASPCLENPAPLASHVCFATSGSTGEPKWIALSKAALLASARAVNEHLGVNSDACWGLALPVHHVGGFGVAARAFAAGCRFAAFPNRWDPEGYAKWLAETEVTHTSLVPTQVHDLAKSGLRPPAALRAVVVGGGRLDETTGRAARDLGWPVLASFGMTETASQIATQRPADLAAPYQPAPLPLLPGWRADTAPDGRLRVAGPALFSGTLVRHGNRWAYQPRDGDWFLTSDIVLLDERGLTPLGRADALVKVLGELVDPTAIERELIAASHGAIDPASLVIAAVHDDRAGRKLIPVFAATVPPRAAESARALYHAHAPGFRRLAPPVFLPDFPRSPLGKPLRAEILLRINKGLDGS